MPAAARRDTAAGRVRCQGETAASGGPAVGGSRARRGSVSLPAEGEEAGGGHAAPAQRLRGTLTPLVQQNKGAAYR